MLWRLKSVQIGDWRPTSHQNRQKNEKRRCVLTLGARFGLILGSTGESQNEQKSIKRNSKILCFFRDLPGAFPESLGVHKGYQNHRFSVQKRIWQTRTARAGKAQILRRRIHRKRSLDASFCKEACKRPNPEICDLPSVFTVSRAWSPFER